MIWLWLGFFAVVGVLLLLYRRMRAPKPRGAAIWAAVWFAIGLLFAGVVYPMYEHAWFGATLDEPSARPGADAAMKFASAYLLEYALAFDGLFVMALSFRRYGVAPRYQPRVLFWALVLGNVLRTLSLLGVAALGRSFAWPFYVFGAVMLWYGVRALRTNSDDDEEASDADKRFATWLWRRGRLVRGYHGGRFWVTHNGRRAITVLAFCAAMLALSDLIFAIDSVYVLSVSTTAFVVVTSNVLATIALRPWFFVLETARGPVYGPNRAIGLLLVGAGVAMLVRRHVDVPPALLLVAIGGIFILGVGEGIAATRRSVPS